MFTFTSLKLKLAFVAIKYALSEEFYVRRITFNNSRSDYFIKFDNVRRNLDAFCLIFALLKMIHS